MNRSDRNTLILIVTVMLAISITLALSRPIVHADSIVLLQTDGMTCGSCSGKITERLKQMPGVHDVAVDVQSAIVEVQYEEAKTSPITLTNAVTTLGFPSSVAYVQKIKSSTRGNKGTRGCSPGGCGNCDKK